jgi:two-component sensor histidine kinase
MAATAKSHNNSLYWLCQLGGWGAYCSFQAWTALQSGVVPLDIVLADYVAYTTLLIATTHCLRLYSKKHRWESLSTRALLSNVLIANVLASAAIIAVGLLAARLLEPLGIRIKIDPRMSLWVSLGVAWINAQISLLGWMALYFGYTVLRQRQLASAEEARLRAALRTAELSVLKSQLNPHFLFNALNTVRALIAESPQRAEKAVTQLARTLRYALNSSQDEFVTLDHELDIVKDYLGIEELRLAERLKLVRDIDADALTAKIPIMLLQTLVENAIKHGISQMARGGTLRMAARMDKGDLLLEVSNDRPAVKSTNIPSDRVGLANANERLRLMIGPGASLKLDLDDPKKAVATVRIPQKSEPTA